MLSRARPVAGRAAFGADLVWPMVLLLMLATLALAALTWHAAERLDETAGAAERRHAAAVLAAAQAEVRRQAADYAYWNDMYERVVAQLDPVWADDNIGAYIWKTYRYDTAFVLGSEGETRIGFLAGRQSGLDAHAVLGDGLAALAAQAQVGRLDGPGTASGLLAGPDGTVRLVGAATIMREQSDPATLHRGPRPVLVFSRPLQQEPLRSLREDFRLDDVAFVAGPADDGLESLELRDPLGRQLGALAWTPGRPGQGLLVQLAPALALAFIAMVALAVLFVRMLGQSQERHRALAGALQAERELGELRTRFVHMVSHELRTPLATMLAATEILLRYADRMPPEERETELKAIRQQIGNLARLVEDVLVVGRAGAGTMPIVPQRIDLPAMVEVAHADVLAALGRGNPLSLDAAGLASPVGLDPQVLRTILGNLLSNAVKFSAGDSPVEVGLAATADTVTLAVSDRGIGIPAADMASVPRPFRRGGNAGHTAGSGLGLAIVRQAVDNLQGRMEIASTVGRGTTVTVCLPNALFAETSA